MNNEKYRKIEEILNSLDGSQRATPPDFFYTRLKARMLARQSGGERELQKKTKGSWILRPAYAMIALILVLTINAAVILQKDETNVNNTTSDNETVQSAAEYYSMNDNTIYDLNPEQ